MRRSGRLLLVAAAAVVAAGAAAGIHFIRNDDEVPTLRVTAEPFRRRVTAEGTLKAVKATPVTTPPEVRSQMRIAWLAPDGAIVKEGDVVIRFDAVALENQLIDGREQFDNAGNRLEKTVLMAEATRLNLARDVSIAEHELEIARKMPKNEESVFSRYDIVESEIDGALSLARRDHALETRAIRDRVSAAEQALVEIDRGKAQLRIDEAESGLRAIEVRAPHDGIFVLRRNWRGETLNAGDTAWRGMPLGEIPDLQTIEAEAFVLEADAGGLRPGIAAEVVLESRPGLVHRGNVRSVEPLARPRHGRSPIQYFGTLIELERTDPDLMKPGARMRATLILEDRDRAITVPRQAIFDEKGRKIVYRKSGREFVPVEVKVASTTAGRAVIESGLDEGDVIALADPTRRPRDEDDETATAPSLPQTEGGRR